MSSNLLFLIDVVVSAEDDVDLLHVLRQSDIVGSPHVGESDHHLAALALQLSGQPSGRGHVVLVLHLVAVDGGDGVEPLPLHEPQQPHSPAPPVHHVGDEAVRQLPPSLAVRHVGHQPGEGSLRHQGAQSFQPEIWRRFLFYYLGVSCLQSFFPRMPYLS